MMQKLQKTVATKSNKYFDQLTTDYQLMTSVFNKTEIYESNKRPDFNQIK